MTGRPGRYKVRVSIDLKDNRKFKLSLYTVILLYSVFVVRKYCYFSRMAHKILELKTNLAYYFIEFENTRML